MEINLPKDTKVKVSFPGLDLEGIIVGKATTDITQTYIIKCTNGAIPNDTYDYDVCVAPLSLIRGIL